MKENNDVVAGTGLYQKHRPKTLEDVVGQSGAIKVINGLFKGSTFPRALLFSGPSGCGKTTLARILQERLGCSQYDFEERNSADFRGIDSVREIRSRIALRPVGKMSDGRPGRVRIWLIDECHQITSDGQDAMLKLLEDAPSHVIFFLATTNPGKLKSTVKTRCTEIALKGVSAKDIKALVKKVALKEGLELPDEVADRIAEFAESSPRKALVLLESCYLLDTVEDMLEAIERGDQRSQGIELARCLMDTRTTWPKVAGILRTLDDEPEGVRRLILSYAQSILLSEKGNSEANLARAYMILSVFRYDIFASGKPGLTAACWELLAKARK